MRTEAAHRSAGFRWGTPVTLADGQDWILPPPMPGDPDDRSRTALGTGDLLRALTEAEDQAEVLRVELALAIHLLGSNYDLGPADFQRVLGFESGSPELETAQQVFHLVAMEHLEQARPRPLPRPLMESTGLKAVLARFVEWLHGRRSTGVEGLRH